MCVCRIDSILKAPVADLQIEDVRQNVREMSEQEVTISYLIKKLGSLVGTTGTVSTTGAEVSQEGSSYKTSLSQATSYIQEGKTRIETLLKEAETAATQKSEADRMKSEEDRKALDQEKALVDSESLTMQKAIVTRLIQEISFIEEGLISLADLTVSTWTDELLLDSRKALISLEGDCKSLSEKITQLYTQMPLDYENQETVLKEHLEKEKSCRNALDSYRSSLKDQISERNFSKERLSSSNSLQIALSKFSGFDSTLDIYTFQAEFEKLF